MTTLIERPGAVRAPDDNRRRLVVIGNGKAGGRVVEEILARGGGTQFRSRCSVTSRTATTTESS
jgi:nitrite reductase (NADH) large subunit